MPTPRPQGCDVVDRWLKLSLAERYESTLRDPIPEALKKLLAET